METSNKNHAKKKKGILALILESMVKTGGCCGSGESCGGKSAPNKNKQDENKKDKQDGSKKS
jgi:hypothetical protein